MLDVRLYRILEKAFRTTLPSMINNKKRVTKISQVIEDFGVLLTWLRLAGRNNNSPFGLIDW